MRKSERSRKSSCAGNYEGLSTKIVGSGSITGSNLNACHSYLMGIQDPSMYTVATGTAWFPHRRENLSSPLTSACVTWDGSHYETSMTRPSFKISGLSG